MTPPHRIVVASSPNLSFVVISAAMRIKVLDGTISYVYVLSQCTNIYRAHYNVSG